MSENIIAPVIPFEEVAVDEQTFEALLSFVRSNKTMTMSFKTIVEGNIETFTLYRFTDEDKERNNMFLHHTARGYFEITDMSPFGNPRSPSHVGIKTAGLYALSVYPVEDLERFRLNALIQHIIVKTIFLQSLVKDEDKDMVELIFEYLKMLEANYK